MDPTPDAEGEQLRKRCRMGVPHVTTFCCCLGLEQGAKVIGYLHLLTSLSMVVICSLFADRLGGYVGTAEDAGDGVYSAWYVIAVVVSVVSVAHALLAATLLAAVYWRKCRVVRVWVWVMGALWAAALGCVVAAAVKGPRSTGSDIFVSFLEGVLFFGVIAYFILVVNSYYLMLKSVEDMEGPAKHDY